MIWPETRKKITANTSLTAAGPEHIFLWRKRQENKGDYQKAEFTGGKFKIKRVLPEGGRETEYDGFLEG